MWVRIPGMVIAAKPTRPLLGACPRIEQAIEQAVFLREFIIRIVIDSDGRTSVKYPAPTTLLSMM